MKRNRSQQIIMLLLALVFSLSSVRIAEELLNREKADASYDEALEIALSDSDNNDAETKEPEEATPIVEPELPLAEIPAEDSIEEPLPELPDEAQFLMDMDIKALRDINEDVLGWISVPGTAISYPLMRSADNSDYLHTTWDSKSSFSGSIFLECQNSPDFSDFHTLVYGHNMKNGTMFSDLRRYNNADFLKANEYVYIATDTTIRQYQVFAAHKANIESYTYVTQFKDNVQKLNAINSYLASSDIDTRIVPSPNDQLLTLSTCTGTGNNSYRWVVQTVLVNEFPR